MTLQTLAIGKITAGMAAFLGWLFAVQTGVSHFDLTVGDMVALGGALAGPPTLLVAGMWIHLIRQIRNNKADYRKDVANLHRKIEKVGGNAMVFVQEAETRINGRIDKLVRGA